MKVLMFGWEFPPHISGGLGTACFGLTKALMKEEVDVLFVVPRLFDTDTERESFLINASAVSRKPRRKTRRSRAEAEIPVGVVSAATQTERWEMGLDPVFRRRITRFEVGVALSPYMLPAFMNEASPGLALRTWNYSMHSQQHFYSYAANQRSLAAQIVAGAESSRGHERFLFSGTYGKNLMEEVDRFAEVGGTLATAHSFDVIHAHDWMTFPAGVVARRKSGKPLVVHVHSTEYDRAGANVSTLVVEIEKLGLNEADRIVAVSNWTKQILITRYHIRAEKIAVVHNGILPRQGGRSFDFPEIASHFVTFLGRVTHQKGPWFFVEAAQKVLQEFPEAHFIVAGAGDLLPQIIERAAQLNMSANFHFTGFLSEDQVDRIWSITDVYVMPSVSEPFGIAPLEAIQGGVPVILSKQSGVAEVMPHAIKVDFWDTKALAAAICSVLRYKSLSNVLRQKGKQHIEKLTWDKAAKELKSVYHELISNQ